VLKVDPEGLDLRPVALGDIDELRLGDRLLIIGKTFGNANTLTTGIVSALGRLINLPESMYSLPQVIQTDAAINPGNSGGPMLNARGEVVGVAFMLQSVTRTNSGIGFGIPAYFAQRVSQAIIKTGKFQHPYIGIRGVTLSPFAARALDLKVDRGVLVQAVLPGTPAEKAGLRGGERKVLIEGMPFTAGGDVITAIDGRPVRNFDDLLAYLGRYSAPGDVILLTIQRNGETMQISLTLAPRP
jgi:2-alkenal reductase